VIIRLRAWAGAAALALLVPSVAAAQPPVNPFADLFGRAPQESGREYTAIQFRSTTGAQWGQTLEADFEQSDTVPEGLAASADANLVGEFIRDRVQAVAHGRYSYQEYRSSPAYGAPGFDVGGRVNFEATTRLSFEGTGQFVRSPFFQMLWTDPQFYAVPTLPADSAAVLLMGNDSAEASAGVTHQLSPRSSLSASAFARETRFDDVVGYDFTSRGARGLWKRSLTRSFGVRAGYSREEMRQQAGAGEERFTNELIDLGIDFSKSFTMGRRTTFAFSTETSMLKENAGPRQFRLNGNASLERRFLRTWVAQLAARRATEFVPGFRAPLFTERGSLAFAGYLAKRLLFQMQGEAARGEVGVGDARQFQSYIGSSTLTVAASRHIGVFAQYVYNHYQMPPDPLALVSVPRMSRQAVAIGVKTWVQLLDKKKVPRDPR
jgi:hypothetical protein